MSNAHLEFERPIVELYNKIYELKNIAGSNDMDIADEINSMEKRAKQLKQKIYDNLEPKQIIQISRHPERPTTLDYISILCTDFIELHGDRCFGDDPSIIGGFAKIDGVKVLIIGHQKGKDTKAKIYRNFGMSQPEGYRKALRLMRLAEKYNIPIVTLVDTPGAFPGIEAEERGQAEAIARNLYEMSAMKVPIISIVTGEGGSGGALGIAVANKVFIMQYGVYSVISPEGCAAILWKDAAKAPEAAKALKITAKELKKLGIVDGILDEPEGGAHKDYQKTADTIKECVLANIKELQKMKVVDLVAQRYDKFRSFGMFSE